MSGLKLAAARRAGLTQRRCSHVRLSFAGAAVFQVVKTAQSRGRTERILRFAGALAGRSTASPTARCNRRNAAERFNPSLLMSHHWLLHPAHHADKR
jgi:hypothetical protein